jgi:hypothetical protein
MEPPTMKHLKIPALALLVGLACNSAFAAGSLEQWEMTSKMIGGGPVPEQKMLVCKKEEEEAKPPLQPNCKYTSLSGSRGRGSFVMECTGEHPSTIKGEGTQTADAMEGTMTILTNGIEVRQASMGKRIGSCDVEGAKMVGNPGLPGVDMQQRVDPRNRPQQGSNAPPDGPNTGQAPAVANSTPAASDPASTNEKPQSAGDKAKKALKSLLPF